MSHLRYVAINSRGKFLVKPKGMHTWSSDLSKARLFKSKDDIMKCILADSTKPSVKNKFKGSRKVECRLTKYQGDEMNEFITGTGQKLVNVHDRSECEGHNCAIHNPSDHHMKDWPLHWRDDRGFFERICKCGVGHPDPDEIEYHRSKGHDITVHGCCGCCNPNFKGWENEKEMGEET